MGAEELGLGEVKHGQLPDFITKYRFFFNPIRYTSLGLAVCEAMMMGMPIVGLATTEMVTAIENGVSGIVHTDVNYLIDKMLMLLEDRDAAEKLGIEAQKVAQQRFNIQRFAADWEEAFNYVVSKRSASKIVLP
jgi:glycosyltransferase involved in cell wall biosynthesis